MNLQEGQKVDSESMSIADTKTNNSSKAQSLKNSIVLNKPISYGKRVNSLANLNNQTTSIDICSLNSAKAVYQKVTLKTINSDSSQGEILNDSLNNGEEGKASFQGKKFAQYLI